jgi:hypothetical protein
MASEGTSSSTAAPRAAPVQEPANPALTVSDDTPREVVDPFYGQGGMYKIDEVTGRRVRV